MGGKDFNKQFDAFKRGANDLVRELHARKLAIPAGALLLAIVAAIVLLPQASTPPAAPSAGMAPPVQPKVARIAQVALIEPSSLDDDIPLANSEDPFIGKDGYKCTRVGSGKPKTYDCIVADLKVRIICTDESSAGPCAQAEAKAAGGSSAATGGSGTGGATDSTGGGNSGGGNSGGGDDGGGGGSKSSYYTVTVSIDGTTKKNVVAGTELPKASAPLAVYAGTNDANNKGVFIAADGVVVTGVPTDSTFGSFTLKKGQTATLTDANGAEHKMTLKSISKVTK